MGNTSKHLYAYIPCLSNKQIVTADVPTILLQAMAKSSLTLSLS